MSARDDTTKCSFGDWTRVIVVTIRVSLSFFSRLKSAVVLIQWYEYKDSLMRKRVAGGRYYAINWISIYIYVYFM